MTGGVAFEAIHQAGGLGTPIVVVLNDNGMSIAPNVGALSRYFNRVRLNPKLWHAREGVEDRLTELPGGIGAAFERLGPQLKESIKAFWAPGLFWEELDWAYIGVIDGHDVRALRHALRAALDAERPVVVHIATVKGKGFAPAEDGGLEGMESWHAAKPKSIANRDAGQRPQAGRRRRQPGAGAVDPGLRRGARRGGPPRPPRRRHHRGDELRHRAEPPAEGEPERYFDVGIAEQQAILFAAGLALEGVKPVAAIYSTFLQRAFDQIVHDVCLQKLNVVFAMDRAGLVGDDGPTHHGVFDIAYLRCLPNIVLMAPRATRRCSCTCCAPRCSTTTARSRCATRAARRIGVAAARRPAPIEIGTGEILREGEQGRDPRLRHAACRRGSRRPTCWPSAGWTSPSPTRASPSRSTPRSWPSSPPSTSCSSPSRRACWPAASAPRCGRRSTTPGCVPPRILRVGLPDRYVTHGKPALLHAEVGFTGSAIAERIEAAVGALGTTFAEA